MNEEEAAEFDYLMKKREDEMEEVLKKEKNEPANELIE